MPIASKGNSLTVIPEDEIQIVRAGGCFETVDDRSAFIVRVGEVLWERGKIIGVAGPVINGPTRFFGMIATLLVRMDDSDWNNDTRSYTNFRVGPTVARRVLEYPVSHPEGTSIDQYPNYLRFGSVIADDLKEMLAKTTFTKGKGGLPVLRIQTKTSAAEIYLHGAHVTHFQRNGEAPLLWMSCESLFEAGKAIRGGIPVILPWFGPKDNALAHGFARIQDWELAETTILENGEASVHLRLPKSDEMIGYGMFSADYAVTIGSELGLQLTVKNCTPDQGLCLEDCLHTYFAIGDISEISVTGLKGAKYLDKVGGSVEKTETGDAITFASEVDRVYMDTASTVEIHDRKLHRKIRVEKEGSNSTVVWNPWIAKAKAMADFGDEEYLRMVCVESGNVGKNKLALAPGKSATMRVKLSATSL